MDIIVREFDDNGRQTDTVCQYHELEMDDCPVRLVDSEKDIEIMFITGNKNKVIELEQNVKLKHVKFSILNIDLPEIQHSEALKIVEDKCRRAYEHIQNMASKEKVAKDSGGEETDGDGKQNNRFLLVEDTCLNFEALNGMPGPYVKCKSFPFLSPIPWRRKYNSHFF